MLQTCSSLQCARHAPDMLQVGAGATCKPKDYYMFDVDTVICACHTSTHNSIGQPSPPRIVSKALQPVVSWTVFCRCSSTTVAVVKFIGVNFHAAKHNQACFSCQRHGYSMKACMLSTTKHTCLLYLVHLGFTNAFDCQQLFFRCTSNSFYRMIMALLQLLNLRG